MIFFGEIGKDEQKRTYKNPLKNNIIEKINNINLIIYKNYFNTL